MNAAHYDAFISFSFKDYDLACEIVNVLRDQYGLRCWICTRELRAGLSYKAEIVNAIDISNALVLVGTCHSLASDQVASEIGYARNKKKKIIPFMCDPTEPTGEIAYDLGALHRIAAYEPPIAMRYGELAAAIRAAGEARTAPPPPPPPPVRPAPPAPPAQGYPGQNASAGVRYTSGQLQTPPAPAKKRSKSKIFLAVFLALTIPLTVILLQLMDGGSTPAPHSTDENSAQEGGSDQMTREEADYELALAYYEEGNYGAAAIAFAKLGEYSDSADKCLESWRMLEWNLHTTVIAQDYTLAWIEHDRSLCASAMPSEGAEDWGSLSSIVSGADFVAGLTTAGELSLMGNFPEPLPDEAQWCDLISLSAAGDWLVGLKVDGTVVAAGNNEYGQCDVSDWTDVVSLRTDSDGFTLGVRADGTLLFAGHEEALAALEILDLNGLSHICSSAYFAVDQNGKAHFAFSKDILGSSELIETLGAMLSAVESLEDVRDVILGDDGVYVIQKDGTLTGVDGVGNVYNNLLQEEGAVGVVSYIYGSFGEAILCADGTVVLADGAVALDTPDEKSVLIPHRPQ